MFDLYIMCVGQQQPDYEIEGNEGIWLEPLNVDPTIKPKEYSDRSPVMGFIDGIFYSLYLYEGEIAGTAICDTAENTYGYPFWLDNEEAKEALDALVIRQESLADLRTVLEHFLEQSPIYTVMLYTYYQSRGSDFIIGSLHIDDFFKALAEGRILCNTCYVITSVKFDWDE